MLPPITRKHKLILNSNNNLVRTNLQSLSLIFVVQQRHHAKEFKMSFHNTYQLKLQELMALPYVSPLFIMHWKIHNVLYDEKMFGLPENSTQLTPQSNSLVRIVHVAFGIVWQLSVIYFTVQWENQKRPWFWHRLITRTFFQWVQLVSLLTNFSQLVSETTLCMQLTR